MKTFLETVPMERKIKKQKVRTIFEFSLKFSHISIIFAKMREILRPKKNPV
jgi:hypothetical protein